MLYWPLYQYSRGRTQRPCFVRSSAVAVWQHLQPTGIQHYALDHFQRFNQLFPVP